MTFFEELGSGAFGVVRRAEANGILKKGVDTVVAVKMLREGATENDKRDFMKEVEIYNNLKSHPNIIGMLGVCLEKGEPEPQS